MQNAEFLLFRTQYISLISISFVVSYNLLTEERWKIVLSTSILHAVLGRGRLATMPQHVVVQIRSVASAVWAEAASKGFLSSVSSQMSSKICSGHFIPTHRTFNPFANRIRYWRLQEVMWDSSHGSEMMSVGYEIVRIKVGKSDGIETPNDSCLRLSRSRGCCQSWVIGRRDISEKRSSEKLVWGRQRWQVVSLWKWWGLVRLGSDPNSDEYIHRPT